MGVNLFRNVANVIQPKETYVFDSTIANTFTNYTNGIVSAAMFSFSSTLKNPNFNMRFDFLRNDNAAQNYTFLIEPFYFDLNGVLRYANGGVHASSPIMAVYNGDATDVGKIPSVTLNYTVNGRYAAAQTPHGQSLPYAGAAVGTDGFGYAVGNSTQQFIDAFATNVQGVPTADTMVYRKFATNMDSAFISRDIVWKGIVYTVAGGPYFSGKIECNVLYLPT